MRLLASIHCKRLHMNSEEIPRCAMMQAARYSYEQMPRACRLARQFDTYVR
jgi:hypothetical protein